MRWLQNNTSIIHIWGQSLYSNPLNNERELSIASKLYVTYIKENHWKIPLLTYTLILGIRIRDIFPSKFGVFWVWFRLKTVGKKIH